MEVIDKMYNRIDNFVKKINFIPFNTWYFRIMNIFYAPFRIILTFLFYYVLHIYFVFEVIVLWIIKGEL